MGLPDPYPGLVISYAYLWSREDARGIEEGGKNRPCAIVLTRSVVTEPTGQTRKIVSVVPVTHVEPADPELALEIPAALKKHLSMDASRSWIMLDETNEFLWPGPDLRAISRDRPKDFAYGTLPPKFFARMTARLIALARARRHHRVVRTD